MDPWQNPFVAACHNSSQKQKTLIPQEEFSDDDESEEKVVYNHNHLQSLRSLYQPGKQDATQSATSNNIQGNGQGYPIMCNSLTSEQKTKAWDSFQVQPSHQEAKQWASLEKLHAFSFGSTHGENTRTRDRDYEFNHIQGENSFPDIFVGENELLKNSCQLHSGQGPGLSQLGKRKHGVSDDLQAGVEDASTWSRIVKEAAEFVANYHEIPRAAAHNANLQKKRLPRGNQTKNRFKFSIRPAKQPSYGERDLSPHKENSTNISLAEQFDALAKCEISAEDCKQHSMVERLQGLLENNSSSPQSSNKLTGIHMRKETRLLTSGKQVLPTPSSRYNLADEDIFDSWRKDEACRDDGNSYLGLNISSSKSRDQSMSDLFEQALNADPADDSSSLITSFEGTMCGFSDRLQKVLEYEKHQRNHFMKMLHVREKLPDEMKCIDIRILAKCFEGKLLICRCTVERALVSFQSIQPTSSAVQNKRGDILTVIFSSRTSGHLEIDVGNSVRIHYPWKELQLAKHEKVIVCTYLSEMAH